MIEVCIYQKSNGDISRCLVLQNAGEVLLNIGDGEAWIEGRFDPELYHVVGGNAVLKPVDPVAEYEKASAQLRSDRNAKLSACDWTQAADSPVDKAAWAIYRQALRDLPSNTVDPLNPVWPTPPTI